MTDYPSFVRAIAAGIVIWLVVGILVARAIVAVQTEDWAREFEGSGGRAAFNVVLWPIALLAGLLAPGIGYLVSGKWKP